MNINLANLYNNGFLPFVGRTTEIELVLSFCSLLEERDNLQVMLITGEAGIGKSRLVDETIPRIIENGTFVLRVRLHEDSTDSLPSLIADALWRHHPISQLLKEKPNSNLSSVISALRRVSRLRRFLLIIEDIHYVTSEGVGTFGQLILSLADESLGLLCSARPLNNTMKEVLLPFLSEEIALSGLSAVVISQLWSGLFGSDSLLHLNNSLLQKLGSHTAGNPLALRMAIRAGIKKYKPDGNGQQNQVEIIVDETQLERSLVSTTQIITQGLIAHLTEQELEWAAQLACLGEVFSREAAEVYLEDSVGALSVLCEKGIIVESRNQSNAIGGIESKALPFCFTHTLLHNLFLEKKGFNVNRFWKVICSYTPLFTNYPFKEIVQHVRQIELDSSEFIKGMYKLSDLTKAVKRTFQDNQAEMFLGIVVSLYDNYNSKVSETEQHELKLIVLDLEISIFNYRPSHSQEIVDNAYDRCIELLSLFEKELLSVTSENLSWMFINLFAKRICANLNVKSHFDSHSWKAFISIIEKQPNLKGTRSFWYSLTAIIDTLDDAISRGINIECIETVLIDVRNITNDINEVVDPFIQEILRKGVLPSMMNLYQNADELNWSKKVFNHLQNNFSLNRSTNRARVSFASEALDGEFAINIAGKYLDAEKQRLSNYVPTAQFIDYCVLLYSTNTSIHDIIQIVSLFELNAKDKLQIFYFGALNLCLSHLSSLRMELAVYDKSISKNSLLITSGNLFRTFQAELHMAFFSNRMNDNRESLRKLFIEHLSKNFNASIELVDKRDFTITKIVQLVIEEDVYEESDIICSLLKHRLEIELPVWSEFCDTLTLLIALSVSQNRQLNLASKSLKHEIRHKIFRTMNWLIESKRIVFARIFPTHFHQYFEANEIAEWTARIEDELLEQHKRLRPEMFNNYSRLSVSMIGKIGFATEDQRELQTIKGNRLKTLLGLMALDKILPKPLRRTEFLDIAAGEEGEIETKRNTVKVAVYQLRKLLGQDAIIQGKEKPELNLKKVSVDAIEVWDTLIKIENDIERNDLKSARNSALHVLRTYNGDVLFPTLYDNIFEKAREEFENRLRNVLLRVGEFHIRENDMEYAERILSEANAQLPGDEEINNLLTDVLNVQNKKIDAVRAKRLTEYESI